MFLFQVVVGQIMQVSHQLYITGTNVGTPEGSSAATLVSRLLINDITPVTSFSNGENATSITCKV